MRNQIISGILKSAIKKKLEDFVFDIMEHPEDVPEDVSKNIEIARQYNFWDVVEGFNLIDSEIGKIQRERTIQKKVERRERELKEKQFQDYLINHPEKLEDIEKGLKLLKSEKEIRSGRLDLAALDEKQQNAAIELKARDYDSIDTHVKIEKYLHEDDTKQSRVFFVAPEIKPDLFFSLRDLQEQGRVKFVEYDFDFQNQEYCKFKEIKADDFEAPRNIPWEKIKRKKQENGLVRVTAAVGKPERIKKFVKETKLEEKISEIEEIKPTQKERSVKEIPDFKSEEWKNSPLYYRVLLMTNSKLENKEKYLKPVEIESNDFNFLESLSSSLDFNKSFKDFKNNLSLFLDFNTAKKLGDSLEQWAIRDKETFFYTKGFNKAREWNAKFDKSQIEFLTQLLDFSDVNLSEMDLEKRLESIGKTQEDYEKNLKIAVYQDPIMAKFNILKEKIIKRCPNTSMGEDTKKYFRSMLFQDRFYLDILFNDFIKLKLERTKALKKTDFNLALSYLSFNPLQTSTPFLFDPDRNKGFITKMNFKEKIDSTKPIIMFTNENLGYFVEQDNELYQSVLTYFKVKEELKEIEGSQMGLEEIVCSKEWESSPLYYKMLLINRPRLKDTKKYLSPVEIDENDFQRLIELKNPANLEKAVINFRDNQDYIEERVQIDYLVENFRVTPNSFSHSEEVYRNGLKKIAEYNEETKEIISKLFKLVYNNEQRDDEGYKSMSSESRKLQYHLHQVINHGRNEDKDIKKFRNLLHKTVEAKMNGMSVNKKFIRGLLSSSLFYAENMTKEFFDYKLKRTEKLNQIDRELGLTYFYFSLGLMSESLNIIREAELFKRSEKGNEFVEIEKPIIAIQLDPLIINRFIKEDNELYESILSIFKVKQEPAQSKLEQISQSTPEIQNTPKPNYETPPQHIEHKNGPVKTKINYGYPISAIVPNKVFEMLHPHKQELVHEFVDGFLNNHEYSNDIRKKYANIVRESKWYSQKIDEEQTRAYFSGLISEADKENHNNKNSRHKKTNAL